MGQKHGKGQRNSIPDPRAASGNSGSRLSVYPEDHQDPIFLPNLGLDFGDSSHKRMSQISTKQVAPPRPPAPPPRAPTRTDSLRSQARTSHSHSHHHHGSGGGGTSGTSASLGVSATSYPLSSLPRNGSISSVSSSNSNSHSGALKHGHGHSTTHDHQKHSHLSSGKHVITAAFEYVATDDEELSVEQGEILDAKEICDKEWWFVESKRTGRQGWVPRNYLKEPELLEPWFAGKITRIDSEQRVLAPGMKIGAFLVRQKDDKEYALVVQDNDSNVRHYLITKEHRGYVISGYQHAFPNLIHLIEHFQSRDASGLCCRLTTAAPMIVSNYDNSYDQITKWEVDRRDIKLIIKVGTGNFGDVYCGRWKKLEVAIKTMKPGTMEPKSFIKEAMMLTKLDHPNLVRLYAVCTKEEPYYIITEYLDHGSLLELLRQGYEQNRLTAPQIVNMSAQIASGMNYLEGRKLVHRDLAARNVLVGDETKHGMVVKVADFGLARQIKGDDTVYEMQHDTKIPIRWTAPESIRDQIFRQVEKKMKDYTNFCDYAMTNSEVIAKVSSGYRLPRPEVCPEFVYKEVFLNCVKENPEDRPTFKQLFTYFDELHVVSLVQKIGHQKPPSSPTLKIH
ncbi:hypothetical protein WR25_08290 [Diploscapter pachys]|uniref:Tyrosine-protein kinase n=1 Tax=Diploscapter pachys TaxID=2018661 RepID=A0A2A2LHL8_9BILA|nr:hypothetical protein WR25_08290 [Diploscapter pachys]